MDQRTQVVIDRTERFGSAEPPNQAFYRTEPNQVKYPNFWAIFGREEVLQKMGNKNFWYFRINR